MTNQTKRKSDRILESSYLGDVSSLSIEELRLRRRECADVEADLSYRRRLLQGRIDIFQHVVNGAGQGEKALASTLVENLPSILTGGKGAGAKSDIPRPASGRHVEAVLPPGAGELRRSDDLAGLALTDLEKLSSEELSSALAKLKEEEARISLTRGKVHALIDQLDAELVKRFQNES